jgi:alpha-L-fucosidase 2
MKSEHKGVNFEAKLKIIPEGGKLTATDEGLRLENADAATLLIAAATNYRGDDPQAVCDKQLAAAGRKKYPELRQAHLVEHRRLFRRVALNLGDKDALGKPTDERLQAMKGGADDPALCALYFQFGRYLLISSSRPGCMPANLQGLWNEHIKAPWNCDYHININVQMNYWPAEVCNLSECHEPFFDLTDNLRPRGRKTAKDVYGCRGFVAHHTTDAWFWTSPIGNVQYGMWPSGAAWCCQHLWEHYAFGGDREFLQKRAYPIMKEAAEFFLDFLVEDPKTGKLLSGPSISPENRFRTPEGKNSNLTMGPAMDQQIVHDLFTNCIEAAEILGIDDQFIKQVKVARRNLAGPKIGSDGRLMEWNEEFEEPERTAAAIPAGAGRGSSTSGHACEMQRKHMKTCWLCCESQRIPTSSTIIRPSRSTVTSAAPPDWRRCCCKATPARFICCPPCLKPGRAVLSEACAPAAASRWTSPGKTVNSLRRPYALCQATGAEYTPTSPSA